MSREAVRWLGKTILEKCGILLNYFSNFWTIWEAVRELEKSCSIPLGSTNKINVKSVVCMRMRRVVLAQDFPRVSATAAVAERQCKCT
jgi:hypothetical protein